MVRTAFERLISGPTSAARYAGRREAFLECAQRLRAMADTMRRATPIGGTNGPPKANYAWSMDKGLDGERTGGDEYAVAIHMLTIEADRLEQMR